MSKTTAQILIDLAIASAIVIYLLAETNPSTLIYLKNYAQSLRYKLWELKYPAWLQEALTVRGKL
jgi:hypothetical protein